MFTPNNSGLHARDGFTWRSITSYKCLRAVKTESKFGFYLLYIFNFSLFQSSADLIEY